MREKPTTEQKHPERWDDELDPDRLAGPNLGLHSSGAAGTGQTAYDVEELHRSRSALRDDDLEQTPIVPRGERLEQGATHLDLADPDPGEFTAIGVSAQDGSYVVPKHETPYPLWNRLGGVDGPERL
jgi:hypothetical protein